MACGERKEQEHMRKLTKHKGSVQALRHWLHRNSMERIRHGCIGKAMKHRGHELHVEHYRSTDLAKESDSVLLQDDAMFGCSSTWKDVQYALVRFYLPSVRKRVPDAVLQEVRNVQTEASERSEVVTRMADVLQKHHAQCLPIHMARCKRHQKLCPVNPPRDEEDHPDRAWRIAAAGSTCVAWSNLGKREKASHNSAVPFLIWAEERRINREDLVFHECVQAFDTQLLSIGFGEGWQRITINDNPLQHGWPVRRARQFSCMLNLKTTKWLGPSSAEEVQQDYSRLFHVKADTEAY
eukprot:825216-Amphidinium_carterae.3